MFRRQLPESYEVHGTGTPASEEVTLDPGHDGLPATPVPAPVAPVAPADAPTVVTAPRPVESPARTRAWRGNASVVLSALAALTAVLAFAAGALALAWLGAMLR